MLSEGAPNWGSEELSDLWKAFLGIFDQVLDEDTQNLRWIQKSLESEDFKGIPLNYQERRIYYFHEEVDRRIGVDLVPEMLRVERRLDSRVEED